MDWEVPNTVIQASSLLAKWRVSTQEDRSGLKGLGASFPISTWVLSTHQGGLCPLSFHDSRYALDPCALEGPPFRVPADHFSAPEQTSADNIGTDPQKSLKASVNSNCFQRLNANMCKTWTLISSSHYSINFTQQLHERDIITPVLKSSLRK